MSVVQESVVAEQLVGAFEVAADVDRRSVLCFSHSDHRSSELVEGVHLAKFKAHTAEESKPGVEAVGLLGRAIFELEFQV